MQFVFKRTLGRWAGELVSGAGPSRRKMEQTLPKGPNEGLFISHRASQLPQVTYFGSAIGNAVATGSTGWLHSAKRMSEIDVKRALEYLGAYGEPEAVQQYIS